MLGIHDTLTNYLRFKFADWVLSDLKPICARNPLIVVEGLGVPPATGYEYAADNTEAEQAEFIATAYKLGRQWGWVGTMFLWNLNFAPVSGVGDANAAFGIVRDDWSPRAAFHALAALPKSIPGALSRATSEEYRPSASPSGSPTASLGEAPDHGGRRPDERDARKRAFRAEAGQGRVHPPGRHRLRDAPGLHGAHRPE